MSTLYFIHLRTLTLMKIVSFLAIATAFLVTGCASVNMAPKEDSAKAKQFSPPATASNAGLYVYRNSFVGQALKKISGSTVNVWAKARLMYFSTLKSQAEKTSRYRPSPNFRPTTWS